MTEEESFRVTKIWKFIDSTVDGMCPVVTLSMRVGGRDHTHASEKVGIWAWSNLFGNSCDWEPVKSVVQSMDQIDSGEMHHED